MNHPLKVYFPHGGKHFIAQFWTHDEQNQIVVAKSLSALDRTLNLLIEKDYDLQVKEIFEVDFVSPPKSLCELAKVEARKIQVEEFYKLITFYVKELVDNKKQLPGIFKICTKWKPVGNDVSKDDKDHHYYCKNCYEKIALKNLSFEEFYEKYHLTWDSTFNNRKQFVDERAVYSRAKPAYQNELWFVNPNFGHHSSGATIRLVEDPTVYVNTSPVLFYFHKIKEIDNSKYVDLLKEIKQKQKEKDKRSRDTFAENVKKEKEEKYQKILKIFEE